MSLSSAAIAAMPGFVNSAAVPANKFELFEVALLHYESEDGITEDELVQVVGLSWCPAYSLVASWGYHVRSVSKPSGFNAHLAVGHQEDCLESELRRLEIASS